jgi:SAM-dependent methyltransferase
VSAAAVPLLGRLVADKACRRWVAAGVPDLSGVDGSRALAIGRRAASFTALLAGRHQHVLLATGGLGRVSRQVSVLPGGANAGAGRGATVRVDRRELLEVEPEIDGRFDLIVAVDAIWRMDAEEVVLPHLGWLVAPGGHLLVVDPVCEGEWAGLRERYLTELPGARVDEVDADVMGVRWRAPFWSVRDQNDADRSPIRALTRGAAGRHDR